MTISEFMNQQKVNFYPATTSTDFSYFSCELEHFHFPSVSCWRCTKQKHIILFHRSSPGCFIIQHTWIYTVYLLLCSSSQCISITDLFDVFFIFQDLMDIIKLYFRRNVFFEELSSNLKIASFIEMAACKYVRNTMRKRTVRRKCYILSFFKRKVIPFREVSLKQMFSSLYSSIEGMNKGEMLIDWHWIDYSKASLI